MERDLATDDENSRDPDFSALPELTRRLARQIDRGRGMRFSQAELDLLVLTGAYEMISSKAAEYQRRQAEARLAGRASAPGQRGN